MGILDKFKKQDGADSVKESVTSVKAEAKKAAKPKAQKAKGVKPVKKEFSEVAFRNLKYPLVTEKAAVLGSTFNQYVFKIPASSTKSEVKKAIQDMYGAKVLKVNVINVPGKERRVGRSMGYKSGYRKAIVFLPADEKIEVISA